MAATEEVVALDEGEYRSLAAKIIRAYACVVVAAFDTEAVEAVEAELVEATEAVVAAVLIDEADAAAATVVLLN